MSIEDEVILALTMWRENRGGKPQPDAMQAVANAVMNRVEKHGTTAYAECTKWLQFSSLTSPNDPQLNLWPAENDWYAYIRNSLQTAIPTAKHPDPTQPAVLQAVAPKPTPPEYPAKPQQGDTP